MVYVPDSVSLLSGKNALILFFGVYLTVVINLIRKYLRLIFTCSFLMINQKEIGQYADLFQGL